MPPKGYRAPQKRTDADYERGIALLGGIDRVAAVLARDFADCPRVLLVTTALYDAHRELSEKREALKQAQEN